MLWNNDKVSKLCSTKQNLFVHWEVNRLTSEIKQNFLQLAYSIKQPLRVDGRKFRTQLLYANHNEHVNYGVT